MGWQGEPLPRGRHKLDLAEVRASQRARIARAMIEVVAEQGFEATTVSQVVAQARVARNAFYEFFADKSDCFLTVTDELGRELLAEMVELSFDEGWTEAVRQGTELYLSWWREHEALARAYFLGIGELGARGLAQRQAAYARFEAMFTELARLARLEQPGLPPLSPIVPRALVFAITDIVAEEIRGGHAERLPELQPEIFRLTVRLLADDATAELA